MFFDTPLWVIPKQYPNDPIFIKSISTNTFPSKYQTKTQTLKLYPPQSCLQIRSLKYQVPQCGKFSRWRYVLKIFLIGLKLLWRCTSYGITMPSWRALVLKVFEYTTSNRIIVKTRSKSWVRRLLNLYVEISFDFPLTVE